MFGTNPIRKQELEETGKLWIQEIFSTIQGEGPSAGTPAVFVRLAGCNLRCWFCDTEFESGAMMSIEDIVSAVLEKLGGANLVVFTGGEPLRQNILPLLGALRLNRPVSFEVETAGTLWIPGLEAYFGPNNKYNRIVVSPKTPSVHPEIRRRAAAFKYIVEAERVDEVSGLPLLNTQNQQAPVPRPNLPPTSIRDTDIFLQPMDIPDDPEQSERNLQAAIDSCRKHGYRLSLQLHKILGLP